MTEEFKFERTTPKNVNIGDFFTGGGIYKGSLIYRVIYTDEDIIRGTTGHGSAYEVLYDRAVVLTIEGGYLVGEKAEGTANGRPLVKKYEEEIEEPYLVNKKV